MPRTFDGVDDYIKCTAAGGAVLTGAMSGFAIVKRANDTNWHSVLQGQSSTAARWVFEIEDTDQLYLDAAAAGAAGTTTVVTASGWCLIGFSRPAGASQTVRFHIYKYSTGAWTHENGSGTVSNPSSSDGIQIGRWQTGDYFQGDIAAAGVWGRQLTDAEFELLAHSLQAIYASDPDALWVLDQDSTSSPVNDLTGTGCNQSAINQTTVSTASIPFSYGHPLPVTENPPAAAGGFSDTTSGGAATGAGGTSTLTITLASSAGAATGAGGTSAPTVTLTSADGAATGAGGTSEPTVTLTSSAGAATGAGGTSAPTFTYDASAGSATAAGGTSDLTTGSGFSDTTTGGTATGGGGTSSLTITLASSAGSATAAGGTSAPTVTLTSSAGAATGAGGTSSPTVTLTSTGGAATAAGGTSTLATGSAPDTCHPLTVSTSTGLTSATVSTGLTSATVTAITLTATVGTGLTSATVTAPDLNAAVNTGLTDAALSDDGVTSVAITC